jgi:hypothetical protein
VYLGCKAGRGYSLVRHALVLLAGGYFLKDGRVLSRFIAIRVVLALLKHQGLDLRLVIGIADLLCGPREAILVYRGNNTLIGHGDSCEEIAAIRPRVASKSEALYKGDSFLLGAIVDLLAIITDKAYILGQGLGRTFQTLVLGETYYYMR